MEKRKMKVSDEEYILSMLLDQAPHAALEAKETELNQYGISAMQATVLSIMEPIGNAATPSEISRWLFRKPHSVSGLLTRMEEQGLVRRVKDLDRKNLVRIAITEKGQQVYPQLTECQSIHKIMSTLTKEERQQLSSCLCKLRNKAVEQLRVERKLPPFP